MNEIRRQRWRVTGRVQGVAFRWSTREKALELGLSGWVRNEPDGSVLVEAQGERARVDALRAWCAVGPPRARVDAVRLLDEGPASEATGRFEVRT